MRPLGDQVVTAGVYVAAVAGLSWIVGWVKDRNESRARRRAADEAIRVHQDGIRRQIEADIRAMERQKHWA